MRADAEEEYVQDLARQIAAALAPLLDIRPLLTVGSAAERLGVSPRTVRHLLERGQLESVVIGEKSRRVLPASLDAYVEQRRESRAEPLSEEARP